MSEAVKKTARELVLEKYPTAFAHDPHFKWVRIRVGGTEIALCKECGQPHTHDKNPNACEILGEAGSEVMAWENAAKKQGLM